MTMNVTELSKVVKNKLGLSNATEAKETVEAVIEAIKEAMLAGEEVKIPGFATFGSKPVEESIKRNPKTSEQVTVPAHTKLTVKLIKSFKDQAR